MKIDPTIYLIDDDAAIRDALMLLLNLRGMTAEAFSSAEFALVKLNRESRGCVLTDLRMPGMSGLELLAEVNSREISLPVVLLTAHGDVATTRAALRGGAFDFLEKPIDEDILVDVLTHAISEDARGHQQRLQTETRLARINTLTQRERQVLALLGRGLQNREIAIELSISPRTVEVYKARMMEKLDCSSIADVVKMSLLLDSSDRS
ncbi:MAG: response regulator [Gammaproteobacteria bacterium]|jgi:two-component system response regulator FixJ|nr:response regulator [Gammaproteobacteria bacterium]